MRPLSLPLALLYVSSYDTPSRLPTLVRVDYHHPFGLLPSRPVSDCERFHGYLILPSALCRAPNYCATTTSTHYSRLCSAPSRFAANPQADEPRRRVSAAPNGYCITCSRFKERSWCAAPAVAGTGVACEVSPKGSYQSSSQCWA
jgi:hypothetical protein